MKNPTENDQGDAQKSSDVVSVDELRTGVAAGGDLVASVDKPNAVAEQADGDDKESLEPAEWGWGWGKGRVITTIT